MTRRGNIPPHTVYRRRNASGLSVGKKNARLYDECVLRKIGFGVLGVLILAILIVAVFILPGKPPPPSPEQAKPTGDANILFVGDMFFDRYIRKISNTAGGDFIFSCIYPFLAGSDYVVGNLEGPITEHDSVSLGTNPGDDGHFQFTFSPETAELLKRNNIKAVTIGNNHIYNFGAGGIASTKEYLEKSGIGYFGGVKGNEPVFRKELNGISFSFIGYNQFGGDTPEAVAEKIKSEHEVGRSVIVFAHWGEEYSTSTAGISSIARLFADNGARAVIGSHPHIVLPKEYIGNTLVYYSLGNFIFDQYWNADVSRGLTVLLHIPSELDSKISVTEYPVILQTDGRTCLAEAVPPPKNTAP